MKSYRHSAQENLGWVGGILFLKSPVAAYYSILAGPKKKKERKQSKETKLPNRFGCSCRVERSQRQLISASCNLGILLSKRSSFQCYPILSAAAFESTVFGLSRLHGNRLDTLPCPPPSDLSVATGKGRGSTWLSCQIVTELRNFLWARIAQNFCWSLTHDEFDTRAAPSATASAFSGSGSRRALPPNL